MAPPCPRCRGRPTATGRTIADAACRVYRPLLVTWPNTDTLPWRGTAAGGGYSTVGDLLRFAQALPSGKLISMATLAEATRPHQQQSGYGFDVQGQGQLRSYGTAAARPA